MNDMTDAPIGAVINNIREINLNIKSLNNRIKTFEEERDVLEKQAINLIKQMGVDTIKTPHASATISKDLLPAVKKDENGVPRWDDVYKWIVDNDGWYLLRKQLNSTPCRALAEFDTLPNSIELIEKTKLVVTRGK